MDGPVINKLSPRLSLTLISAKYTHALIMDVFWPGSGEVKSVRGNDSWLVVFHFTERLKHPTKCLQGEIQCRVGVSVLLTHFAHNLLAMST